MRVPNPAPDSSQLETRLELIATMLDRAVAEVRRAVQEIKDSTGGPMPDTPPAEEVDTSHGDT